MTRWLEAVWEGLLRMLGLDNPWQLLVLLGLLLAEILDQM